MKKISLLFAVAVAALGFSSCTETWDDNPVLTTHEGVVKANFLNNPVMQDQVIMLTEDNKDGNFHLTCSQPEFGYAAIATYKVQVSLTEDFAEYQEIDQAFYDCSEINPVNGDVAAAIEKLSGVKTENDLPLSYQKMYVRLRAYIEQSESNTTYLSNVVSFAGVSANYLAIWVEGVPANLFLRGGMNDWGADTVDDTTPGPWQFATGPDENTWVIYNISIPAGTSFKVADATWGSINLGCGDDSGLVTLGEPYTLTGGDNPGNLYIDADFTGKAHLSYDKGTYTLTLDPAN
jgi:hypothetical protein